MEADETVEVIFRKYPGGDVIALFPCLPGTVGNPNHCESFMHMGQHGAADPHGVMASTAPASPVEYAALKRELESYPYRYRLEVRARTPSGAYEVRAARLRAERRSGN
jgi:hypothetical protein